MADGLLASRPVGYTRGWQSIGQETSWIYTWLAVYWPVDQLAIHVAGSLLASRPVGYTRGWQSIGQ